MSAPTGRNRLSLTKIFIGRKTPTVETTEANIPQRELATVMSSMNPSAFIELLVKEAEHVPFSIKKVHGSYDS